MTGLHPMSVRLQPGSCRAPGSWTVLPASHLFCSRCHFVLTVPPSPTVTSDSLPSSSPLLCLQPMCPWWSLLTLPSLPHTWASVAAPDLPIRALPGMLGLGLCQHISPLPGTPCQALPMRVLEKAWKAGRGDGTCSFPFAACFSSQQPSNGLHPSTIRRRLHFGFVAFALPDRPYYSPSQIPGAVSRASFPEVCLSAPQGPPEQ